MTLREKVLNMRMNEFGFSRVAFFGSDKDVFPQRMHIVKWVETEPRTVYSLDKKDYIQSTQYCYAIAELSWNEHEPCWEFSSVGTRFLEDGTEELMKWILAFTEQYEVVDGELVEVRREEDGTT